jgi:hypothetical protein
VLPRHSLSQLLRRRGLGQLECSVCHSGRGGFAIAGNLHRWEGEFYAIGIGARERPDRERRRGRVMPLTLR